MFGESLVKSLGTFNPRCATKAVKWTKTKSIEHPACRAIKGFTRKGFQHFLQFLPTSIPHRPPRSVPFAFEPPARLRGEPVVRSDGVPRRGIRPGRTQR